MVSFPDLSYPGEQRDRGDFRGDQGSEAAVRQSGPNPALGFGRDTAGRHQQAGSRQLRTDFLDNWPHGSLQR